MKLKLLLIEDDDIDREVVQRALEKSALDAAVTEADCVEDAQHALLNQSFDCILSDLSLPDGDGLELLKAARDTPFVVLTGSEATQAQQTIKEGAQDYLIKDRLDPYRLERAITYAIERKRLQVFDQQAEHNNRLTSLGRLASSVAHEINNPTAFVLTNIGLVQRWLKEHDPNQPLSQNPRRLQDIHQCLAESLEGLERIARTVRQMQNFARQPDPSQPPGDIEVAQLLQWVVTLTQHQLTDAGKLELDIDGPGSLIIQGHPGRLAQAITNLLLNAAQAISDSPHKHIKLTALTTSHHLRLIVEDSGPGMSKEVQERAFEPFFTTLEVGKGTGMGLTLCRQIVLEHKGTIQLDSSPLGGLKVTIALPIKSPDTAPVAEPKPQEPDNLRILFVDDEPILRRAYARLLHPHKVHAFEAREADQWMRQDPQAEHIQVVICDLMMPHINGRQFYQRTVAQRPDLASRFIFCSGGVFHKDIRIFLDEHPELPVLLKPIAREEIEALLGDITADD